MRNITICLIGLFLATNSSAQSNQAKNNQPVTSKVATKNKEFSVPSFKIPVGKGDNLENISAKNYNETIKTVDKIPDFITQQELKQTPPSSKGKVFPPNITNFTAEDIKNDPTLQKGKVFYVKEEVKPALSVVEEYNQKRERFLKKRENAKNVYLERMQQQRQLREQALKQSVLNEQKRRQLGLPISRLENTKGPNGNEAGVTREAMSAMSNGTPLPKVPPTGIIR